MIPFSTRLRRALHLRSLSLVRRIILSNPSHPNLLQNHDTTDKNNTSLHLAALLGLPSIAAFLLDHGHESSGVSRNADGLTPLMLAAQAGSDEKDDSAAGRCAIARLLVARMPECVLIRDKKGMDAFAHAAHSGTTSLLSTLLALPVERDVFAPPVAQKHATLHPLLTTTDLQGNTPLHHASAAGHLKAVRLLVDAGADPGARNAAMWTPIDYSASVAAEVYLRNLAREKEARRFGGAAEAAGGSALDVARGKGGVVVGTGSKGGVRMVESERSDSEDEAAMEAEGRRSAT